MRNTIHAWLVLATLGVGAVAFAQRPHMIDINGNRREFDSATADATGNLTLRVGGSTQTIRRGQYRYVVTPKPPEVVNLERAGEQGNHRAIIANAPGIFEKYRFLGWGGYIASIEAQAKLATNDAAGALSTLQAATSVEVVGPHEDAVNKARISTLIALDRGDEAATLLQRLKASRDENLAAFAFLAEGKIMEGQGRRQEAILSYLKTVLLFREGAVETEKREARARVAALLDEMGDVRAQQFR